MIRACRGCQKVYANACGAGVRLLVLLNEVVLAEKMQDSPEVAVEFLQRLRGPIRAFERRSFLQIGGEGGVPRRDPEDRVVARVEAGIDWAQRMCPAVRQIGLVPII